MVDIDSRVLHGELDPQPPEDPWGDHEPPAVEDLDAEFERRNRFELRVNTKLDELRVLDEARDRLAAEKAAALAATPFDAGLLEEILARPAEPPHRVDGLIPSQAGVLVVAQRKVGKTTFDLNLGRCLLTGEKFLGRFEVRPLDGRVGFLNYEVGGGQLARWADEAGVDRKRFYIVNLRGRRNPFGHDGDRAELAEQMRRQEVEALFVDPFSRAYTGKSQNDPGEVAAWLAELDRFARTDAGVVDIILNAHAGWDGERTRGASALEDWADSIITLVTDPEDRTARFMRAVGRDIEVDEDQLRYDQQTRTLSLTGTGSRQQSKADRAAEAAIPDVLDYVAEHPDSSGNEIREGVAAGNKAIDQARRRLVERGDIVEGKRAGRGGGKCYRVAEETDNSGTAPTTPQPRQGVVGTTPTTLIEGVVPEAQLPIDPPGELPDGEETT
jgi:hypothetical protein